jgi:AcrR family transcriptional regulator
MARTPGARNNDYDAKRAHMAAAVARALVASGTARPSLRQLARATGFSVNNLRHYFESRDGLIAAALAAIEAQGKPHTRRVLAMADAPASQTLKSVLREIAEGWDSFLGDMHVTGLAEGLGSQTLGPAYVTHLLEPTLQSFEQLLGAYAEQSLLRTDTPLRELALSLLSPVLLALLHQSSLSGERCRPLDIHSYIDRHVDGFLRAYGA